MSLDHAVLGFLNYRPLSGYDLKKMFDGSVRHFWYADQSQIYRTLAKLAERGWVEMEVVEQSERPDRKVYHITAAGQTELREWLAGPFPMQQPHSGPLVQVFFSGQLSDEEVLHRFKAAADFFRMLLATYNQIPPQMDSIMQGAGSPREKYFWGLTVDLGIRTMQAQLDWAEDIIRTIKANRVPVE